MRPDAELLRQYAATRDEAAFAELVQRHLNLVYRAALRQLGGDPHRAQEAAQLVFTLLARKAGALERHPSLAGWLYTTTHFTVRSLRRDERRRQAREQEAFIMHDREQGDRSDAEWERLRPVLDDAMQQLGERDRLALLARFFEARSFGEIGAHLALSEDAARMRVERALDKLRALLARRGVTSSVSALHLVLTQSATGAVPVGLASSVSGAALAAIATAGGSAGLAVGLLHFMSTSKIVAGAGTVALAMLMATAVFEARASRTAENARVAGQHENDVLAARLRELRQRAEAAEKSRAAALEAAQAPRATVAARLNPATEAEALLARHPEVREALIGYQRANFRTTYDPLFRTLRLMPEQIDRCVELLLMQGVARQVTGPGGALRFKVEGNPAEAERQLRQLLGEEGFKQYRDFVADLTSFRATASLEWNQIATTPLQLASALHATATPLDAAQAERLRDVVTASLVSVEWSDRRQYDWDKIMAEARGFLSEPQLAMLERQGLSDKYLQAMNRTSFQQRQAGKSTTPDNR